MYLSCHASVKALIGLSHLPLSDAKTFSFVIHASQATQACWKFVEHLNQLATGTITVDLYKGNVSFRSAAMVPHSLYSEDTSSMENVGEFDHRDSEGLLGVLGVGARALNRAGQTGR